jgi:hypothetical protein
VSILTHPTTPRITQPIYDPNINARKCSTCGARDRWQRLLDGGWFCCWVDTTPSYNPTMAHECTPACTLAVPA